MPRIWDALWGHLARLQVAPVVVGEFGGRAMGSDATLQLALTSFMASRSVAGGFYWSLNPESADTGGLIDGWGSMQANPTKLDIVSHLLASPVPSNSERSRSAGSASGSPSPLAHTLHYLPIPPPFPSSPPPPPSGPPPPYLLEVKRFDGLGSGSYESRPPTATRPSNSPVEAFSVWLRQSKHPPPPSLVPKQPAFQETDAVWLVPGVVLSGWAGLLQLLLVAAGIYLLRQLLCVHSKMPVETASEASCEEAEEEEEEVEGGARHSGGKRWQRIPATGASAGEDSLAQVEVQPAFRSSQSPLPDPGPMLAAQESSCTPGDGVGREVRSVHMDRI